MLYIHPSYCDQIMDKFQITSDCFKKVNTIIRTLEFFATITYCHKKKEELAGLQYANDLFQHILVVYLANDWCERVCFFFVIFFFFFLHQKVAETPSNLPSSGAFRYFIIYSPEDKHKSRQTDRQTDRQSEIQTNRQTQRYTGGLTESTVDPVNRQDNLWISVSFSLV